MSEQRPAAGKPKPGTAGNVERAEERVDRVAAQLARFFADDAKPFILRTAGRAREQVEDVLAEARSMRRGGTS
jgi:hypothetical protein